ncbi:MAG: hypothetical protein PHT02_00615 [Tissierellia bacterium]|nr:hypothetical protein [Tissierellia bacterium]
MLGEKKKVYNIILEKKVKQKIDEVAQQEDRSSSAMINWILKKWIEENHNNDK